MTVWMVPIRWLTKAAKPLFPASRESQALGAGAAVQPVARQGALAGAGQCGGHHWLVTLDAAQPVQQPRPDELGGQEREYSCIVVRSAHGPAPARTLLAAQPSLYTTKPPRAQMPLERWVCLNPVENETSERESGESWSTQRV